MRKLVLTVVLILSSTAVRAEFFLDCEPIKGVGARQNAKGLFISEGGDIILEDVSVLKVNTYKGDRPFIEMKRRLVTVVIQELQGLKQTEYKYVFDLSGVNASCTAKAYKRSATEYIYFQPFELQNEYICECGED